jgi:hypothetical protein
MNKTFDSYVYVPSERLEAIHERRNLLSVIILLIAILFIILEILLPAVIIIAAIIAINIWVLITHTNKFPKLKGSFPVKITISPEQIIVGKKKFSTSDIQIKRIVCYDYRGRNVMEYALLFKYMAKSNGVDNYISFIHNGNEYKWSFRVDSKNHTEDLEEIKKVLNVR